MKNISDEKSLDTIEELNQEIEELKEEIKRKNKKIKELQEFQKEVCDDIERYPYGYFGVSESDFH